jgi:2-phosphoglycerate kinase
VQDVRVILIGGTSHTGKSTIARELASHLGLSQATTDHLARHPGRPWRTANREIPPHVVEHYENLTLDELIDSVFQHYRHLWPRIEGLVEDHVNEDRPGLVLEGSALWPSRVIALNTSATPCIWLSATEEVLRERMHANSGYERLLKAEQHLVDRFLARTLRYQELMMSELDRLGLPHVDVTRFRTLDDVTAHVMESITRGTSSRTP